ncbi:MAG TPA: O-antigen ligase family protein, partial [Chitinophagaceae bacterium]|nr:O-antigen ligase family protein [Chitinophagaceae bacterium]
MLYVYKSMLNKLQNDWRRHIIFLFAGLMLASLFLPRAFLTITMTGFAVAALADRNFVRYLRRFISSPLLWGMSLLFFIPLLSGLWSEDSGKWMEMIRIKLPLFVLPLAFAGAVNLSAKQWEWLATLFVLLVTAGTIWSVFHYLQDMQTINEGYLMAKAMLTPLQNDRIRFSWLVAAAILTSGWLVYHRFKKKKAAAISIFVVAVWLIIYLHLLAVRTGLFSFYLAMIIAALWLVLRKLKWQYGVLLMFLTFLLPVLAYFFIPTFQNRVKYIRYDAGYFQKAHYLPGGNDAIRVISLKAGCSVMLQNPLKGTGFGDVPAVVNDWYRKNYPDMKEQDKVYPASEWLMYGAGAGLPGFIVFTVCM